MTISLQDFKANGPLQKRAITNFARLETEQYQPPQIFREESYSWPGDWEGRTILGLVLLAQSTKQEPTYLKEIMRQLPEHLNAKGDYGPIHPQGTVDEQQLSGNSWLLRAMVEHYLWQKDELSLKIIQDIIQHLLLLAAGYYTKYPVFPEQRVLDGAAVGELLGKVGDWYLSSDIGCAFIMLDGATHAYQVAPSPELNAVIAEMIAKFNTIDILQLSFQTHATLSALRGLMRHYETTGDPALLAKVEATFLIYTNAGMTENYANYNWFGRPDWTEPCAIVDSYMVAVGLWKHTAKIAYLDIAHHILFNGLGYGQRPNGGFGCDVCAGAHNLMLSPKSEELFEAFWCCTMRGAEGLSQALEYSYHAAGNQISIPFYEDSLAQFQSEHGAISLKQTTAYPIEGVVQIEVVESSLTQPITIRLYIPSWTKPASVSLQIDGINVHGQLEDGFISITGPFAQGSIIKLTFNIQLRREKSIGHHSLEGIHSYRHGVLLLGIDSPESVVSFEENPAIEPLGNGIYRLAGSEILLTPINDMIDKPFEAAVANRKQVLFR
ncbi:hypothetical protein EHS13_26985 [Paenibacillus psychroresistens]|uniref:Glycoside hydrolase family 127 protein n=1 Tax=Paenibacillus psychroresistens TaxID=1778678 RepID=A0A6B8RSS5_9BACL|nr:beta-L-arabinofuranosidase domain-containing protein [Paenibacillus psychroresistens]QGQ98268.1 hypothetical protein EHS13_26985 [Paenibacillus psychroresistens]